MPPQKINRISIWLLAAGFTTALLLFIFAPAPAPDALRDDPLNERRYRRQLRVIGGEANQLSADFIDWFGSLWSGRNLAGTVAVLTLVATGGFRFIAVRTHPRAESSAAPPPGPSGPA